GVEATVIQVEYDPNRSARIALIEYPKDDKNTFSRAYILAPDGLKAGDKVMSGDTEAVEPKPGNCMPLSKIPLGMTIHNVELVPGKGGQMCRSAGCSATLGAREKDWALITLPSGEVRKVSSKCRATIGSVSNAEHMNISIGKAGRMRWKGRKPHNRGTSQNPTDHPRGGGGRDRRRPQPVLPDRRAGQGRQDPQEAQARRQGDRPPPPGRPVPEHGVMSAKPLAAEQNQLGTPASGHYSNQSGCE